MTEPNTDGYYYRDAAGKAKGPLSRFDFEVLQATAVITPGTSVWRQSFGQAFKVTLERQHTKGKLLSFSACNHAFELLTVVFATCATIWAFSLVKWSEEKNRGGVYLVFGLSAVTFVLVLVTVRTVYMRWRKASTVTYVSEV